MSTTQDQQKSIDTKSQGLPKDICQRLNRLVIALYRLTDYFDEKEPIKYEIRVIGNRLIKGSVSFISLLQTPNGATIKDIKDSLNTLYVQFDVLEFARIVSETNAEIVKDEIVSLLNTVENFNMTGNIFVDISLLNRSIVRDIKDNAVHSGLLSVVKEVHKYADKSPALGVSSDPRKRAIVDYLKLKGSATIRDLTSIVKGCSEKTIQRELGALIGMNIVRKEGDKRWSRYLIADERSL